MIHSSLDKKAASMKSHWLLRLAKDLATFCDMWILKQPELMSFWHNIFSQNYPPLCDYLSLYSSTPIGLLVILSTL